MDISILLCFQRFREITLGIFDSLFLYITAFGEDTLLFLGSAGIYWSVNKQVGFCMCFHYHLSNYVNQFIKLTVCVNRPWIRDSRIHPVAGAMAGATGYSFPSGHTAKAIAVWGSFGVSAGKKNKHIPRFFFCLAILVGISRNYLGVHTPQDVVVSLGIGIVLLTGTDRLIEWCVSKEKSTSKFYKNWRYWLCIAGLLLAIILCCYVAVKPYPLEYINGALVVDPQIMIPGAYKGAGGLAGLSLGWLLERKTVGFRIEQYSKTERILRFLYGSAGLIFILKVLPPIWNYVIGGLGASILNGFIPAFYIVGFFPLLADAVNKRK